MARVKSPEATPEQLEEEALEAALAADKAAAAEFAATLLAPPVEVDPVLVEHDGFWKLMFITLLRQNPGATGRIGLEQMKESEGYVVDLDHDKVARILYARTRRAYERGQ